MYFSSIRYNLIEFNFF